MFITGRVYLVFASFVNCSAKTPGSQRACIKSIRPNE